MVKRGGETVNIVAILALATLAEAFVEYFVVPLLEKANAAEYAKYAALVVGVGLCLAYGIDILAMVIGLVSPYPYVGMILSGTIIGRGANYVNDFIDFVRGLAVLRLAR